jgi:hypothetical protein
MTFGDLSVLSGTVESGDVTWADVEREFRCDRRTVWRRFEENGIEIPVRPAGRRVKPVPERVVEAVMDYRTRFRTGYHRTTESLARQPTNPISVSDRTVRKIFDVNDLYLHHQAPPRNTNGGLWRVSVASSGTLIFIIGTRVKKRSISSI